MDYMWAHAFKTFYRLHDLATNWHQARQICEAEGTSLLVPGSLEEMENLKLLISNMKAHYTAIFIGIHDQFSEGDFVTIKGKWNFNGIFSLSLLIIESNEPCSLEKIKKVDYLT